ncbi:UNVERIFIED_CONTAM: hypothetical protein RMT77_009037 [Armadillidium vulgare]
MNQPSTSEIFNENSFINSSSLNLSVNKINNTNENEEVDDDIEEVEVDESEKLHLQKVTSFVQAAYERVEEFSKQQPFLTPIPSRGASEASSHTSTVQPLASIPESIDGGRAEIEELKSLPVNFDSALRTNQALQRRLTATLNRLEKTLQENLIKQAQLIEEEEDQGIVTTLEKDKEYRNKYFVRPSSFSIPYFKDRCGMPAPMNNDTKYKVDNGYLDLYSTRLRTWLTSEHNMLVNEVLKEWKEQLIKDWNSSLRNAERKLKNNSLTEEEITKINSEIDMCKNHINFFTNVPAGKIEIPRDAKLDWDRIAAQTFDGSRSPEECQLLWENLLHPDISQEPFSEEEDLEIQETLLSCNEENPDWEEIAKNLNSGRTPFQVMQRWVSFIRPAIQPASWTPEASKKLEDTINMLRAGNHIPWALVSQHLTGYTKVQLQSRWRNINPDQYKGPFSTEEDFILIKGLYKFGMNFDVISYFLPGRSKVQVRERFKRAIMPGLTSQPWTWREDKKIINNCSFVSQHWRMMAQLLPKRDTCQIRLRFYILHFWQNISEDKNLPPPLFPLSMTTRPSEVKKLREKIVNFDCGVRIFLDSIQANNEGLKKVDLSEKRRNDFCKKEKPKKLAKFLEEKPVMVDKPKFVKTPRRRSYGPREQSWPDKALTEYFLPGRGLSSSPPLKKIDDVLKEQFHRIAQAFQIKVNKNVTLDEIKALSLDSKVNKNDAKLVNSNLVNHHIMGDYGVECLACDQQEAEIIPLMPVNCFTMGAFRSMLLHKPKLEEMAAKEFLLYEVPQSQLHKLGEKPKTLNEVKVSREFEIPDDILDADKITNNTDEHSEKDSSEEGSPKKRKAAAVAALVNYVYSKEVKKPRLLKEPTVCKEVLEVPNKEELDEMQLEGENVYFRGRNYEDDTKENIIEEEDKLLFHRLLSLFFWPALLCQSQPDKEQLYLSKELAEERELNCLEVPDVLVTDKEKGKDKFGEMDLEETAHLIKKLEAVRKQKRIRYQDCYLKPEVSITMDDMKQRVYKKDIIQLKRSLIMKKAWTKRKQGLPSPKTKPNKVIPQRTRPVSARLSSRLKKTRNDDVQEEEEET